jgi:glucose/arabinose dehydrogenase
MGQSRHPILTGVVPVLLAGAGLLSACASAEETAASPTPQVSQSESATPSATPSPSPSGPTEVAISVTVADGQVSPPPSRVAVPLGSPVALTVASDVADEIHVHGYELEEPVRAGGSVTIRFTADTAGLFEVETHETEKLLLQLQVS